MKMTAAGVVFLAYLLGVLPTAAFRSVRRLRDAHERKDLATLSRTRLLQGTLVMLGLLFVLTWMAASDLGFAIFARQPMGGRDLLAALLALGASFGLAAVGRRAHSSEERRTNVVYLIAPRLPRDWVLWTAVTLLAGVTEEAAYRGVAWSLLSSFVGHAGVAAFVCATAFSLAHATQGWKSALVVCGLALVLHALVAFTHTLVLAMAVHVIYDMAIGYRIGRRARRLDLEAMST